MISLALNPCSVVFAAHDSIQHEPSRESVSCVSKRGHDEGTNNKT